MICFSGARVEPSSKFDGQFCGTPTLVDIALGLGRTPRFGGQSRRWWSGIHHALVCIRIAGTMGVGKRMRMLALLHDAHEAITGDVPAFFKPKELSVFQDELDERIFKSLGIEKPSWVEKLAIKVIDDRALKAEAYLVGPPAIMSHLGDPVPEDVQSCVEVMGQLPSPLDTDGIDSKGAQLFLAEFAFHIGEVVSNRRDDTKRD